MSQADTRQVHGHVRGGPAALPGRRHGHPAALQLRRRASTPSSSTQGYGGHIVDVDGNDYIDMLCAYGPIILGYDEPEINEAVKAQMDEGLLLLPRAARPERARAAAHRHHALRRAGHPRQDRLRRHRRWPSASPAATPTATRSSAAATTAGTTGAWRTTAACPEAIHGPHRSSSSTADLATSEAKLEEHEGEVACIIITPVGHPLAKPVIAAARTATCRAVRELADKHKVVLIFDEIRTGFRVGPGRRPGALRRHPGPRHLRQGHGQRLSRSSLRGGQGARS
ncbi:MAG: aminotransferase class III-fold pyridoxal phosphate-dependent enzyme [Desulfobacterales bacterium]|nr:aminotransferase class III-fold pyridoxal phosphate-dependent enzyme [Desulfobacterales bacterium]